MTAEETEWFEAERRADLIADSREPMPQEIEEN